MAAPNLQLVQESAPSASEEADNEFVWTLALAAVEILYGQCELSAQPNTPVKFKPQTQAGVTVNAEVDIIGKGVKALLHLGMPEATFLEVMSKMMGEKFTSLTPDIESGVTELTNIIFGAAKEFFGKGGVTLERAIPKIVKYGDAVARIGKARRAIQVSFESDAGPFEMIVAFEN